MRGRPSLDFVCCTSGLLLITPTAVMSAIQRDDANTTASSSWMLDGRLAHLISFRWLVPPSSPIRLRIVTYGQ